MIENLTIVSFLFGVLSPLLLLAPKPDWDDHVWHYVLFFLGMVSFATIKKLADWIGADIVNWIKRRFRK